MIRDLVAEVISPSEDAGYVRQMTNDWFEAGVRLAWNIYPDTRTVVVIESGAADKRYGPNDILTGAPVLPDFQVRVSDLFAE